MSSFPLYANQRPIVSCRIGTTPKLIHLTNFRRFPNKVSFFQSQLRNNYVFYVFYIPFSYFNRSYWFDKWPLTADSAQSSSPYMISFILAQSVWQYSKMSYSRKIRVIAFSSNHCSTQVTVVSTSLVQQFRFDVKHLRPAWGRVPG